MERLLEACQQRDQSLLCEAPFSLLPFACLASLPLFFLLRCRVPALSSLTIADSMGVPGWEVLPAGGTEVLLHTGIQSRDCDFPHGMDPLFSQSFGIASQLSLWCFAYL